MTARDLSQRDIRQRDIIPADRLADLTVTVVGVGAVGRQVALQLAAIGVRRMQLVDFDRVEVENLAPQGYFETDLGQLKVEATAELCRQINSGLDVEAIDSRFKRSMIIGDIIFCCVDAIETRRHIWQAVKDDVRFYADTRMSAEVVRVLVAADVASWKHYPTTLFVAGEAHQGACTAKSTIYTANIAAGLAVGQFTKWLRGLPVDADVALNILAAELTCGTTDGALATGQVLCQMPDDVSNGEQMIETPHGPVRNPCQPPLVIPPFRPTGIAEIDDMPAHEIRDLLAKVYCWMYCDPDTGEYDVDRDISGADTVQLLCELLPYPP